MDFFEVVEKRQSVRKYSGRPVLPAEFEKLLRAVNQAPSAGNCQAYEIYVLCGPERMKALAAATFKQDFVAEAPVALVFCSNASRCTIKPPEVFSLEDATVACSFAVLVVTALGMATCWVAAFRTNEVAQVIGAPEGTVPIAILPVGYAAEQPERTTRRELKDDLIHFVK